MVKRIYVGDKAVDFPDEMENDAILDVMRNHFKEPEPTFRDKLESGIETAKGVASKAYDFAKTVSPSNMFTAPVDKLYDTLTPDSVKQNVSGVADSLSRSFLPNSPSYNSEAMPFAPIQMARFGMIPEEKTSDLVDMTAGKLYDKASQFATPLNVAMIMGAKAAGPSVSRAASAYFGSELANLGWEGIKQGYNKYEAGDTNEGVSDMIASGVEGLAGVLGLTHAVGRSGPRSALIEGKEPGVSRSHAMVPVGEARYSVPNERSLVPSEKVRPYSDKVIEAEIVSDPVYPGPQLSLPSSIQLGPFVPRGSIPPDRMMTVLEKPMDLSGVVPFDSRVLQYARDPGMLSREASADIIRAGEARRSAPPEYPDSILYGPDMSPLIKTEPGQFRSISDVFSIKPDIQVQRVPTNIPIDVVPGVAPNAYSMPEAMRAPRKSYIRGPQPASDAYKFSYDKGDVDFKTVKKGNYEDVGRPTEWSDLPSPKGASASPKGSVRLRGGANILPEDFDFRNVLAGMKDFSHIKDTNVVKLSELASPNRVFRSALGDAGEKAMFEPFARSKSAMVDWIKEKTDVLHGDVVKGLGINSRKNSALLQKFGEGKIDYKQLKLQVGSKQAQNIARADMWFKETYPKLLDELNEVRVAQGRDPIAPIEGGNYYRHMQDNTLMSSLKDLIGGEKVSYDADPMKGSKLFEKFLSIAQKRTGNKTKFDAIGGMVNWLKQAAYDIHMTPEISRVNNIETALKDTPNPGRFSPAQQEAVRKVGGVENLPANERTNLPVVAENAPQFMKFLSDYQNDLAGKPHEVSRVLRKHLPNLLPIIDAANSRVMSNSVGASFTSAINNLVFASPYILAKAKTDIIPGALDTVKSLFKKDATPISESPFMKERANFRPLIDRFDFGMMGSVRKMSHWLMDVTEWVNNNVGWNSFYRQATRMGMDKYDSIRYADKELGDAIGRRGLGEKPRLMTTEAARILAPFMIEPLNNMFQIAGKISAKDYGWLAILLITNYAVNNVSEKFTGRRASWDPIGDVESAITTPDLTAGQIAARSAASTIENIPVGPTITNMVLSQSDQKKLFGRETPGRFGGGILSRALKQPQYFLLPPTGGGQIKKSVEATQQFLEGGKYPNNTNPMQIPMPDYTLDPTFSEFARGVLFGPSGFPEAQEFYKRTPNKGLKLNF